MFDGPLTGTHRCTLGMGIERPYRSRGHGRALLDHAIAWAETAPILDWVDLGVFDGNEAAMRLYTSRKFIESGRQQDRFRINGMSIADISMSRWVGATPRGDNANHTP